MADFAHSYPQLQERSGEILGHLGTSGSCRDAGCWGDPKLPNSSGSIAAEGEQGAASFDQASPLHGKLRAGGTLSSPGTWDTCPAPLEPLCSFCLLASSTSGEHRPPLHSWVGEHLFLLTWSPSHESGRQGLDDQSVEARGDQARVQ